MKIIDKLISDLTGEKSSLTDVLINSKVLAHKLKNKEFINWVNYELNGYPDDNILPDYRIISCRLVGTVVNGYNLVHNFNLPIPRKYPKLEELLLFAKLTQSISTFDEFIRHKDGHTLSMPVPISAFSMLNESLTRGSSVHAANRNIDKVQIIEVITKVKSKLLDFLLNLNDAVGDDSDEKFNEEETKEQVSSIINNTIYGGNPIIVSGNNNTQSFSVANISKGDFVSLEKLLHENGIEKEDTKELSKIIDSDTQDAGNRQMGVKVTAWMGKMVGKAANGTWKMAVGAASELLVHAIMRYYGWE